MSNGKLTVDPLLDTHTFCICDGVLLSPICHAEVRFSRQTLNTDYDQRWSDLKRHFMFLQT